MSQLKKPITVYLPDTRGVEINRYGMGNLKLGFGVFTYSRLAGQAGANYHDGANWIGGTCPGSTPECEAICYAKRIEGPVRDVYAENSATHKVPPIPDECLVLRIHVSGDFNSEAYIREWVDRLTERPDVTCWAYTRSWRVPALLPDLEVLRALPNVQLFASMDQSHTDVPPIPCKACGELEQFHDPHADDHDFTPNPWRRAWIDGDVRAGTPCGTHAYHSDPEIVRNSRTFDGTMSLVCPEETKHKRDCLACGYCFEGNRNDVTFLRH